MCASNCYRTYSLLFEKNTITFTMIKTFIEYKIAKYCYYQLYFGFDERVNELGC